MDNRTTAIKARRARVKEAMRAPKLYPCPACGAETDLAVAYLGGGQSRRCRGPNFHHFCYFRPFFPGEAA